MYHLLLRILAEGLDVELTEVVRGAKSVHRKLVIE